MKRDLPETKWKLARERPQFDGGAAYNPQNYQAFTANRSKIFKRFVIGGLCISILFHASLLVTLISKVGSTNPAPTPQRAITVDLIPQQKNRIVSEPVPTKKPEQEFKEVPKLQAEKDNITEVQSLAKNNQAIVNAPVVQKGASPKSEAPDPRPDKTPENRNTQKTQQNSVKPKPTKSLTKSSVSDVDKQRPDQKKIPPLERAADSSDSDPESNINNNLNLALSGALASIGSSDSLPDVKDGKITMLNTKANKYATFVRRVATQVFNDLKFRSFSELSFAQLQSALRDAEVRAILDSSGKLLSVSLNSKSGSFNFDSSLQSAVRSNARDPNPPADAAVNSQFIFIFRSNIKAQRMANGRNGQPYERRYLLLQVGLL